MSTLSPRLSMVLPDDGGPGGDDVVDVTQHITNNLVALEGGVGLYECTSTTRPTTGNFNGRLIEETDTGKILMRHGATWIVIGGPRLAAAGTGATINTWTAVTDIASATLTAPEEGWYDVRGETSYDVAVGTKTVFDLYIAKSDNTVLATAPQVGTASQQVLAQRVDERLYLTANQAVKLRCKTSQNGTIQLLSSARISMMPAGAGVVA